MLVLEIHTSTDVCWAQFTLQNKHKVLLTLQTYTGGVVFQEKSDSGGEDFMYSSEISQSPQRVLFIMIFSCMFRSFDDDDGERMMELCITCCPIRTKLPSIEYCRD